MAKSVFYSYSHVDELLRDRLEEGLALLKREGVISNWHDRCIRPGSEFDKEISEHVENDDVILLLISSAFINSDYCFEIEMAKAMERHEAGDAIVVPIILRPCDWHTAPFGRLNALPEDGRAVTTWENEDVAFAKIVSELRSLLTAEEPNEA